MQEKTGRWGNKRKVDHEFKKTLLENLRPENIHEIQIENFKKKNKIKAKIANGFGNSAQNFGIYSGHVVHSSLPWRHFLMRR